MKKLLLWCLTAALLLGGMGFSFAEEKTPLTLWVPENLRIADWKTNDMTLWLEEQGNFDLTFITQPSGSDYRT